MTPELRLHLDDAADELERQSEHRYAAMARLMIAADLLGCEFLDELLKDGQTYTTATQLEWSRSIAACQRRVK